MATSEDTSYIGREQTLVKHFILQKYLERFAHIVGSRWDVITYVDCFSGPWNARSEKFEDSSFAIALRELRNARSTLAKRGRSVELRCFFLEKNRGAYAKLKEYADSITDVVIETRNAALEDSISEIVDFVQRGSTNSFPFIFIDPTGWTGFGMEMIAPLLRLNPGEVLINFMTGHIRRFLDSPDEETQESFRQLFGSGEFRAKIKGLGKQDREDTAIAEYSANVKRTGGFTQTCSAIVLHPQLDRTHFNLIYATRNTRGIEVFKDAEKKAMAVQEQARGEVEQRRRESRTGQFDLLASSELHDTTHYSTLRERYLTKARSAVQRALQTHRRLLYDHAWSLALCEPMVWESDLKQWVEDWVRVGQLEIQGMRERQRVPHRGEQNFLILK
jgi:three-Cys-motif partner protein